MRNTTKFLGIIALAAVIIFSMASCGNGGGGGGFLTVNNTTRELRITGFADSYHGYWVAAFADGDLREYIAAAALSTRGVITGGQISSSGEVTLRLWYFQTDTTLSGFTGGDSNVYLDIAVFSRASGNDNQMDAALVKEGWSTSHITFGNENLAATIDDADITWD